jgi:hypothetical protein
MCHWCLDSNIIFPEYIIELTYPIFHCFKIFKLKKKLQSWG